jgi:hypothetical protein
MMRPILAISAAASLMIAGAALAQTPAQSNPAPDAPAASAPAPAPAPSVAVNDAELKRFATVGRSVKTIMDQHQPAIAAAADPAAKAKEESAMSGELQVAVTDAGFTVQRYNEIAQAMQKDPGLFARMQQLAAGGQPATSSNQ